MSERYTEILAKLKSSIEEEISKLTSRISELKETLKAIDYFLVRSSLKTADKLKKTTQKEEQNLLKSGSLGVLGELIVNESQIIFTPNQDLEISDTAPSFKSFFIPKVLEAYVKDDAKLIEEKKLDPKKAFNYKITKNNSLIEKITIQNYRTQERLKNIKKTLRWAIEKAVT